MSKLQSLRRIVGVAVFATVAAGTAAFGEDKPAPVLAPSQMTEDNLVDALAIDPGPQATDGQTRGIRPTLKPGAAQRASGPGRANLLITFATDSAELTADGIAALTRVAQALQGDKLAGFAFRVEGHADPRGASDHNMSLSEQRAQAVVAFLVDKMGVLPERLTAVGKGDANPLVPDQPADPRNRRVTIVTTR